MLLKHAALAGRAGDRPWREYLLRRAYEFNPDHPDVVFEMGTLMQSTGALADALESAYKRMPGAHEYAWVTIDPAKRLAQWGQIDKTVTKTAAAIPWLWEDYPTLFSSKVTPSPELWNSGGPDVTFMAVK